MLHYATGLEPGAKEGSATLTLITTDVARVTSSLSDIHELWIIPVEVCVAAWLLGRQVGVGALGPAVTFVRECRSSHTSASSPATNPCL